MIDAWAWAFPHFPMLMHLLGHLLLHFCRLLANGIGIITVCLRCGIAGALKHLAMAINRLSITKASLLRTVIMLVI